MKLENYKSVKVNIDTDKKIFEFIVDGVLIEVKGLEQLSFERVLNIPESYIQYVGKTSDCKRKRTEIQEEEYHLNLIFKNSRIQEYQES